MRSPDDRRLYDNLTSAINSLAAAKEAAGDMTSTNFATEQRGDNESVAVRIQVQFLGPLREYLDFLFSV